MKVLTWKARRSNKVTLVELASRTGISKSTLNNIEYVTNNVTDGAYRKST